jgi:hypothetical protein
MKEEEGYGEFPKGQQVTRTLFCHSRADGGLHPFAHPLQIYQKASTAVTTTGDVRAK